MKNLFTLILTLLVITSIAFFSVYKAQVPAMQADIASRAQAALTANGMTLVDVKVAGLDITLTGFTGSERSKQLAEKTAQVFGYHTINNQIQIDSTLASPPSRRYSLDIYFDTTRNITLKGALDADTHKALRTAATKRYGDAVVDDVQVLDIPVAEGMPEAALLVMDRMVGLNTAQAIFSNQKISVKGSSASKMMLSRVKQRLIAIEPKGHLLDVNLALVQTVFDTVPTLLADINHCQKRFNTLLRSHKVRFRLASSSIRKSSYRTLNKLTKAAKNCSGMTIKVHGHTDSTGRNSTNKRLSKKRARVVADYFITKGVPKAHLVSVGHGSSKPIASNKTYQGRARNRRIELTVERVKQ